MSDERFEDGDLMERPRIRPANPGTSSAQVTNVQIRAALGRDWKPGDYRHIRTWFDRYVPDYPGDRGQALARMEAAYTAFRRACCLVPVKPSKGQKAAFLVSEFASMISYGNSEQDVTVKRLLATAAGQAGSIRAEDIDAEFSRTRRSIWSIAIDHGGLAHARGVYAVPEAGSGLKFRAMRASGERDNSEQFPLATNPFTRQMTDRASRLGAIAMDMILFGLIPDAFRKRRIGDVGGRMVSNPISLDGIDMKTHWVGLAWTSASQAYRALVVLSHIQERFERKQLTRHVLRIRDALDPGARKATWNAGLNGLDDYMWMMGNGDQALSERRQQAFSLYPVLCREFFVHCCQAPLKAIDEGRPFVPAAAASLNCPEWVIRA